MSIPIFPTATTDIGIDGRRGWQRQGGCNQAIRNQATPDQQADCGQRRRCHGVVVEMDVHAGGWFLHGWFA
ncbi:MAG: hypothetical protein NTV11_17710 [Rhodocyclales bacterium]|nr:hypothetical protein [Rhodocyclales bacterium]